MGKSVNKSELAEIFGVSERTLTEWQNDSDLPIKTKGARGQANEYDTEAVITWFAQRELNKVGVEGVRDRLARLHGWRPTAGAGGGTQRCSSTSPSP